MNDREFTVDIIPVIFEDHLLARMRPAVWSTPVFELRCGMFNTRERVDLSLGGRGGVLLGRAMLGGLNKAASWEWGSPAVKARRGPDSRFLFLSGRLAPDFSLVEELTRKAAFSVPFTWHDDEGLVAALLDGKQAEELAAHWDSWEIENDRRGVWSEPSATPAPWLPDIPLSGPEPIALEAGGELRLAEAADPAADFNRCSVIQAAAPGWIWNIVEATGPALRNDLAFVAGRSFRRQPFGIFLPENEPAPDWTRESAFRTLPEAFSEDQRKRWDVDDPGMIHCAEGVDLAAGTAFNASGGPIILDRGVRVMPHCYLEGPLYIGPGSLVKPGARLHGESSFGLVNRIAGEIGESTFGDFANKQHAGFIGHAVLGAWINLGALTTCSDLKNNYGEIRVDLGCGAVATGSRFVGLMMGDHAKSAIGTMFNTGTTVGFASNIFGGGMPPKFVGNFQWGGHQGDPRYAVDRAQATSAVVMSRRGCVFTPAHADLFQKLGG